MSTVFVKPVSVSIENITPEHARSERTIFCTPMESADAEMIEAVGLAIIKGAVGKNRSEAFLTRLENSAYTMHIQVRFVLAGEAGIRQVFGCGA